MEIIVLFLAILLMVGCTSLTPGGAKVRVTSNQDAVKGCELKGAVKGTSSNALGSSAENANIEMRNNAAEMGADTVLLMTETAIGRWSEARTTGEAYDCSKKKEEEARPAK